MQQTQTIEGYRLGPQQRHLWLLERQGGPPLVVQGTLRLEGDLDRQALREAARQLLERHEILRTSFASLPGMQLPIQVVLDRVELGWREAQVGTDPAGLAGLEEAEASIPFTPGEPPHVRFVLAAIGPKDHALIVTQPALCADAHSLMNLARELSQIYDGLRHDLEPLPEPLQYVQFSEWHNDLAEEDAGQEGREFWHKRLGSLAELPWPFGPHSRRSAESTPGWEMPPDLLAVALRMAGEEGLPALLLGCWALLLSRLAGVEEVAIWNLFAGRKFDELSEALGAFDRYLPLRLRLSEGMSTARLLKRTEETVREGEEWQEYFDLNGDGAPELRLGFAFHTLPRPWDAGGIRFRFDHVRGQLDRLRLQLSCWRSSNSLRLEIDSADGALDPEESARLASRFQRLLRSAVETPAAPVSELEIVTEEERRRLLLDWNGPDRDFARHVTLPQLFEEQVARSPQDKAISSREEAVSFEELNRRANRLAHRLRRLDVGPESRVAFCLGRGIAPVATIWGILKTGAAYVPLDPMQPRPRLHAMLEDAGVEAVVTDGSFQELFAGLAGFAVILLEELGGESEENPPLVPLSPAHLAYVLYTSGSTGRPKGVMVSHGSVVNLGLALEERVYLGAEPGLRVSLNAPLSFDASVKQLIQTLRGRTLVVVPEEVRANGEDLLTFLEGQRLQALDCTPSQLHLLFEAGLGQGHGAPTRILVGGEAVSAPLWERLSALPETRSYNVYGPTECTVDTTACEIGMHDRPVLGRPLANVRAYVLDPNLRLVPVGLSGELCVGGEGVSRGYIGRPDLTAERFVPDPFGTEPGGRLYRTGDLARWGSDGLLEFLGRIDHQVKVRGFRIELGEIEGVLRQHPGVAEAIVVLRSDDGAEHAQLVAYAVPRRSWAPRIEGRLRRALPNGAAVVEQNRNETDYLFEEIFSKRCYFQHGVSLPPNACVFDVGANIGMFSLFVRQESPRARVFAFEPIAPIFETLRINSDLYFQEARLLPFGLSDRERTETFTYYPRYSMMSSQSDYSRPDEEVEVIKRFLRNESADGVDAAVALLDESDELLAGRFEGELHPGRLRRLSDVMREEGVERIDLLKIDVQRAEMDVLRGILDEDWARIDQVVMEVHDAEGKESEGRIVQIAGLLRDRGFQVVVEQDVLLKDTDRYNLYAVREGLAAAPTTRSENPSIVPVLNAEDLREHLRQHLPEPMLPGAVVLLDELPLTRNGKVDRSALPAPEAQVDEAEEQPSQARTPFEEILAEIWSEVLRVPRVGLETSFFDLGGHSLLATQLISRVREAFPMDLPLRSLFEGPTVRQLAQRIEQALRLESGAESLPLARIQRNRPLPLSFAQERLWFLEELTPGSALYNSPRAVRIRGDLKVGALAAALTEVVRRHEVLRTSFPVHEGEPIQSISPPGLFLLPVVDLRHLGNVERETEAARLAADEARRPFDLARGPLMRATLLWTRDRERWLLATLHHIISDGWSMGLLIHEISVLYESFAASRPSPLPELPIQYADFAGWQRAWLSGETLERELGYWRQRLLGSSGVLDLPSDRPRPAVRSHRGTRRDLKIPERLALALRALSRRERATLFMTLLAGFQGLLGRLTGQTDFNVGTPIAGRNRVEIEGLLGLFVNTLVLRANLGGDPSLLDLIGRTREVSLQAYAHQDLPFERIVDELAPERSLSHSPLFQVVFGLQPVEQGTEVAAEVELEPVETNTGTAKFDLTLTIADDGLRGLEGSLEYSTDLFDATTIDRLLDHYRILLEAAIARPGLAVSRLNLLGEAERHHVLTELAGGGSPIAVRAPLHRLFEEQARRSPDRPAVVFGGESMTYAELDRRATDLAVHLVLLGVRPESRVGLCTERGFALVLGILGILKAGGAYVPLDPSYPEERLRYLVEDSGIEVVLTDRAARARLPEHRARVLDLDEEWKAPESAVPLPEIDPDNLAYVIYTSGSTGRPKGGGITHANVVRLLKTTEEWFDFSERDCWTLFHSHAFDFSVWEIWGALAYGGRLVVVPYLVSRSPADFLALLERERVTVLNQTPSAFRQLIAQDAGSGGESDLALRWVIFGGEALDLPGLRPWFEKHGDRQPRLVNMYGITETTVHVTCRPLSLEDSARGAVSLIGGPLRDLSLYLLDAGGEPAPIGTHGEMFVGGAGVARGYLGRPDLTAERFVPDPFSGRAGARLYRSGDLARRRTDGDVEYVGRIDHQIKIRGFRIELGEIEAALAEHPAVRHGVAMVRPGDDGEKRLVAYLVAGSEPLPGHGELRNFLQRRLPEHAIPVAFVPIPDLPITAHGKVDRAALPAPGRERLEAESEYEVPRTFKEQALAEVWAQVLGLERVGLKDNFFALGGDSILSIRVRALAAKRGISFDLQDLFRRPTLEQLAGAAAVSSDEELPGLVPFALVRLGDRERLPRDLEDAYPLSRLQAGMLFHSAPATGAALYHNVTGLVLKGPIDVEALRTAVSRLAAMHPVLRTSFDTASFSEPLQLVQRSVEIPVEVVDLRDLSPAEQDRVLAERFELEKTRLFDWSRAPLLRFWVHLLGEDRAGFGWTEHHAILDGWSVASLISELFTLYFACLAGEPLNREPPAATYRDFVALERRTLESGESRRYWAERLADAPVLKLPRWPRSNGTERRSRTTAVRIAPETAQGLARLAEAAGVPFKSVLLASHVRLLALLGGTGDVVTGIVSNSRPENLDGERVLGLFLNSLPLRLRIEEGAIWRDLVRSVLEAELGILPHRRYPLADLQREHAGGQPLFESVFNYVQFHVLRSLSRMEVLANRASAETNFTLFFNSSRDPQGDHLRVDLVYDPAELRDDQVLAFAEHASRILLVMASNPDGAVGCLPLPDSQRHQLLVEWNDRAALPSQAPCLHHLFEAQAERRPEALALVHGETTFTYARLNGEAGRLARRLRALGIGPEDRVALCLPRSPGLITAMLAALKSGAAYVPLDPESPKERLSWMIGDSGARLLVTERELAEGLATHGARVLCLDDAMDTPDRALPRSEAGPQNAAYLIYTSGTTDHPKGVVVTHGAVVNHTVSALADFEAVPEDRWLQFFSPSFDASAEEIYTCFASGATLVLRDDSMLGSGAHFLDALDSLGITVADLPTSFWHELVSGLAQGELALPASLRLVIVGGEKAHGERWRQWQRAVGSGVRLVNAYGPTETTISATRCDLSRLPEEDGGMEPPLGRPVHNLRAHVLDRALALVVPGAPGELCVAGAGLARGYQARPDLTAEAFVPDPFGGPGDRLYRTGDLVRRLPEGNLEYLGRIDLQIKVRGFRVEVGEIEAALTQCQGVREAAVVLSGEGRLVAHVVPAGEEAPDAAELRRSLALRLPGYMVPSAFVVLDRFPLTTGGKIDRHALPAPQESRTEERKAPRTPGEEILASIWEQVLGREGISVDESFFDLGGHSLSALQVASRVRAAFGVDLSIQALFAAPTLAELAAAVESALRAGVSSAEAPPLVAVPREGELPLSFAQERLWFLDRLEPDSAVYNIPVAVRLSGGIRIPVLAAALSAVVRRHEALRTVFLDVSGEPRQVIQAPGPVPLPVVDLAGLPEGWRLDESRRLGSQEARRTFDLSRGPLLRSTALKLSEREHVLLLTLHHIVSDGWSMEVLQREMEEIYESLVQGREASLPGLAIQYGDYAVWQRGWLTGEALERRLAYWRGRLGGSSGALELPLDRPRPAVQSFRGSSVPVSLSVDLRAPGRREGATPFMVALAGLMSVLHRWSDQEEIRVGTPVAGRDRLELEPLIGFFVNTLVLRGDVDGREGFSTLLGRLRGVVLEAYAHQDLPFEKLVQELEPERSLSRSPLFQVMLSFQGAAPSGEGAGATGQGTGTAKFDLTLSLAESEQGLVGSLGYASDLFDRTTILRLAGHFTRLLASAAAEPSRRLDDLPLLGDAERHQVAVEWCDTGLTVERAGCLHELFREQALRTPAAEAVSCGPDRWTFDELEKRANGIAHRLLELGVRPGDRVALCLERSASAIAALLGILKAGAAYVPLDMGQPASRLAAMLEDSGASAVLTRESLEALDAQSASPPEVEVGSGGLAYVIYTSGSTGRPKGTLIEHRSVVNLVSALESAVYSHLSPAGPLRVSVNAPLFFDASVKQWTRLLRGDALAIVPEEVRADGEGLLDWLRNERVDVLDCTPSQLRLLVEAGLCETAGSPLAILAGGEAIDPALWEILASDAHRRSFNVYGPTECTVDSTVGEITSGRVPTIGRAVANLRVRVLGSDQRLQPAGVPGELCVSGAGLAWGYLGRPDLTAAAFVPDPHSGSAGSRLYRTGDLARWLPDGRVEFLGRIDHQIKLRGFRVEPGEVETALLQYPRVRAAVVNVWDRGSEHRLVAWLVCGEPLPSAAEVREHLRSKLPEAMVPASVVFVESLPLTPNGKIDRRALPEPEAAPETGEGPRTPVEEILCGIFAEVLGLEWVGREEGFFDLGGHSLLATRAMSRLRQAFHLELPLRTLFERPTAAALAASVESALGAGMSSTEAPPLIPVPRKGELPLSFAQERLWFLDRLEPDSAVYNIPVAVRLSGKIRIPALGAALSMVVRRHEALRTVFLEVAGEPRQVIQAPGPVPLPVVDLSGVPDPRRLDEARRLGLQEARRVFDLSQGPLLRSTALRLSEREHVLLLTLHHIVSDGWSMEVLQREMEEIYESLIQGGDASLPELAIQYGDYAVWQGGWLTGEALERRLAYWRERLGSNSGVLDLPLDRPRPAVQSFRGSSVPVSLSAETTADLRNLGRREGATLFMVVLAGLMSLLHRWSGQEEVRVGTPVAGRDRLEVEPLIGFFVNTLVLRGDVDGREGFSGLLSRLRNVVLEAYAHQDLPFEKLVQELEPERSLSRSPLFQVMLSFQSARATAGTGDGMTGQGTGTAKFDLSVALAESARGLVGSIEYASDLFDRTTILRLAGHFARLLASVAAEPSRRLDDLPLLGDAERHQVAVEWCDTGLTVERASCLHELFREQALRTPTAEAVSFGPDRWTFDELERRANGIAHRLLELGVQPGDRVALCLERSASAIAALLGILKAGAAYVPLDVGQPASRLAAMLEDSGASAVLTRESVEAIGSGASAPPEVRVGPGDLAYVIYTSGSTGRPKGTLIEHRSVVNLVSALESAVYSHLSPAGPLRVSVNAPLFFDASVKQWTRLLRGDALAIVPEELRADGEGLLGWLRNERVDVLDCTPSQLRLLVEAGLCETAGPPLAILAGGEAIDPALWEILASDARRRSFNVYGPTECTVDSTVGEITSGRVPTIGRAVANLRVRVLDSEQRLQPAGVPGELCVSGAGLARGYLGRPDLTAEKFVPDPHAGSGSRLYRTGDLARWLPDGRVEFLGRIDHQIKVRGFRVEPGEVETALAQHPAVRAAVVDVRSRGSERRLVAWLVCEVPHPSAAEVREHLRSKLPEAMVPSAVVFVESLPLTPNGKVDRRALPEPEAAPETGEGPRTPIEEILCGIFAEVLGLESVGREEGFFDLGGHSLLATRAMSRLRQAFHLELPLRTLFERPTAAALAASVESALGAGMSSTEAPPLVPVPRKGELPLSFAQERLWFLDRLDPGSAAYNIPIAVRLSGEVRIPTLGAALGEVVRRHEALRTVFLDISGEPRQRIQASGPVPLPLVDLSGVPDPRRLDEARRLGSEEARRVFDLSQGPLLRSTALKLSEREHVLLLTLHHIVSDGWSMEVLQREIGEIYESLGEGRAASLPELAIQYGDYALWQRSWLTGEALERRLAYWRERLGGSSGVLELPLDRPRPAIQSFRGSSVPVSLSAETTADLRSLGRREGATPFMVVLAGLMSLLHRWSGQEEVRVGTPVAGRDRLELEPLIGFFVNTLVLRGDVDGREGFSGLLRRLRSVVLEAYAHQDLPFEKLVHELEPERSLSRSPLCQVMLSFQSAARSGRAGRGDGMTGQDTQVAKFDLTVALAESAQGLAGSLGYASDLFDRTTILRLAGYLARLLASAAADPETAVERLAMMSEPERQQLLVEWNASQAEAPAEPVHRLFERRAMEQPGAPAVVSPQGVISYGQLDRRCNGLAKRLQGFGVGPETVVAIRMERSAELVLAALAVLKAGGAYLPIDPRQPRDRQVYMLQDSGTPLLLTTRTLLDVTLPVESLYVDAEESADAPPPVDFFQEQLAYVIYTSGSTGEPKGTELTHGGLSSLAAWHRHQYGVGTGDRATLVAGPGFDASVWEVWPYLTGGATLHVPASETVESPPDLAAWLYREKVTLSFLPTPLAEAVLAEASAEELPLRVLLTGGDRLHRRPSAKLPYALVNHYGPTESTVVATAGTVEPGVGLPTLGRPIANTRVHVVDPGLLPVAAGVAGEICLAGTGLARGYRGRPSLTAERFVPDPFGEPGSRLYRTGDLARWRADGVIEFLGRIDAQVKIRGFRIETGEIEAALRRHGSVREAAVVLRDGRLAAYVVLSGGEGDARALRSHLAGLLPEYMLPASWMFLDALPRNTSGKIDRRALPGSDPERCEDAAPPRDAVELALVRIWEDVLGVSSVGVRDDFFELGGHSLLAIRLIARIARELEREPLPLATLFQLRTIERLAARLREDRGPLRQDVLVEIQPGREASPLFLVHPVGGNVFCYSELARALGTDRPCFGLQIPGSGNGLPVFKKLEDMAELYCKRVRAAQPSGPYVLGGWSMGGPIALEMARRIRAAGDEVLLLLLDPPPPTPGNAPEPDLAMIVRGFVEDLANLSGRSALGPGDILELELSSDPLRWALQRASAAGWLPPDLVPDEMARHFDVFRRNLRALWRYRPRPYPGDAVLVLTGSPQAMDTRAVAWTNLLGSAEILRIPGDHYSLLRRPRVAMLAERLAARIKEV